MNRKVLSLLVAMVTAMTSFAPALAQTSYTDVADSAPYAEAVEYCLENGLMVGTSDTEFSPDESTSRAMLVTILYRNAGLPQASGSITFTDVPEGTWYYDAIRWAANTGLVNGYNAESFGPDDTLQREQILSILWRADGETQVSSAELPYTDSSSISAFANEAVNWAYTNGMIDDESATLRPQGEVPRADMAVLLYRYLTLPKETPAPTPTESPNGPQETVAPTPAPNDSVEDGISITDLSDADLEMLKSQAEVIRYDFEQSTMPAYVFDNSNDIYDMMKNDGESFVQEIKHVWDKTVSTIIIRILLESDTNYTVGEDFVNKAETADSIETIYGDTYEKAGLRFDDLMEGVTIVEDQETGDYITVIEFKNADSLVQCKYLSIVAAQDNAPRYFTAENDILDAENWYFCEVTKDGRKTAGIFGKSDQDFDTFVDFSLTYYNVEQ